MKTRVGKITVKKVKVGRIIGKVTKAGGKSENTNQKRE